MSEGGLTFNRRAVRPMECLREGWRLIKDDYWLFLGITFVGSLLGSVAMGVLRGPATCGIHICFFRREAGKRVTFDLLLKGFDYFVQSLIATILMTVPIILLMVPGYVGFFIAWFGSMATVAAQSQGQPNQPPDLSAFGIVLALFYLFLLGVMLVAMLIYALFLFVYPLIVDRGLSGIAAMKLSARAALANVGGVLGLMFLMFLLGLVGALMCYVGLIFTTPLMYAMIAVAYRQVFPAEGSVLVFDQPPPVQLPEVGERFARPEQLGIQQPVETPLTVTAATPPPPDPGGFRRTG